MHNSPLRLSILLIALVLLLSWSHAEVGEEKRLRSPAQATGVIDSASVAVVGGQVITSREVQIFGVLTKALASKVKPDNKIRDSWVVSYGGEAFTRILSQFLVDQVVALEAETFSVSEVSEKDIQLAKEHILNMTRSWPAWKRLDVSDRELVTILQVHLRAQAFLKFKSESSGVLVSDSEAQEYYEKNRVKFGNLPFEKFKDSIKDVLAQEQLEEKLKDWFELLKRKYRVRLLSANNL